MEVRFFSTMWLGADKEDTDRGWWTLRDTGAMAAKLRGQWHSMTDRQTKKWTTTQRCGTTEA